MSSKRIKAKDLPKARSLGLFFKFFPTKYIFCMQTYQSATISFYLPIMMILFCTCILYKSGSNALRRMERGHISSQKFKQFSPKSSHKKCEFSSKFPFNFNSSHLKFHRGSKLAWFSLSTLPPKNHTDMRFSVKRIPSTEEKEIPGSPSMATNHDTKHMIKYVEIPYTSWTGRRQFSFKNQRSGLR